MFSCREFSLVLLSPRSFRTSVCSCWEFSLVLSLPGVFSLGPPPFGPCPVLSPLRTRLGPASPRGGDTSRAGSESWARVRQCFPCRGIKKSGLILDCYPVNPGGGHIDTSPLLSLLPRGVRLPSALQGLRRGLSPKCCWRHSLNFSHCDTHKLHFSPLKNVWICLTVEFFSSNLSCTEICNEMC